jgi:hypothetical protein
MNLAGCVTISKVPDGVGEIEAWHNLNPATLIKK